MPRRKISILAILIFSFGSNTSFAYDWQLPKGFPKPIVPADNPMSKAKVELGKRLFFDKRLSYKQNYSCASCHQPQLAFTDGLSQAIGSTGEIHSRSAMSLFNVAYSSSYGWADNITLHLEQQALIPLLNTSPLEMGMSTHKELILDRFRKDPEYIRLFSLAFNDESQLDLDHVQKSLASFERTLFSGQSAYDLWLFSDEREALSPAAKRGMSLFFSKRLGCGECHAGLNFSGTFNFTRSNFASFNSTHEKIKSSPLFVNNGLYKTDPLTDTGLSALSKDPTDNGRFKIPTLRNITITGPYMHDGSISNLFEVIDHYAKGGMKHTNQHKLIKGFRISPKEKQDLILFLHSLEDKHSIERHIK